MGDRKLSPTALLTKKSLDLLDFDQREILARLFVATEVPIAFDARARNDTDELLLHLWLATLGGRVDALDHHRDGLHDS